MQIPTLTPVPEFNAAADVEALRNAFNFPGLESTVINILTHRSYPQRQDIITTYRTHGTVRKSITANFTSGRAYIPGTNGIRDC